MADEKKDNDELNGAIKAIFMGAWAFLFNIGKVMALLFKALAKSIKERKEKEAKAVPKLEDE